MTKHKQTDFEKQWGYRCDTIAEYEMTTPEAIRMRVRNFGSPFIRSNKKGKYEKKYGKNLRTLAKERGVHPHSLSRREVLNGHIDTIKLHEKYHPMRGKQLIDVLWHEDPRFKFKWRDYHMDMDHFNEWVKQNAN